MDDEFVEMADQAMKIKLEQEHHQDLKAGLDSDFLTDPYTMGKKFFEVMCGLTTGEANVIVRSTVEKFGSCGFGGLYLLNKRCRPNTHAR